MGPAEILGWYLALPVGAFLLAWLYQRSRASILVVAVFHAVLTSPSPPRPAAP